MSFFFETTLPGTAPALSFCRLTCFRSENISFIIYSSSPLGLLLLLETPNTQVDKTLTSLKTSTFLFLVLRHFVSIL